MSKQRMRSIGQSRELNAEYTRLKVKAWCKGCSGTEGDCSSLLIKIPTGTSIFEVPQSKWKGCGVPQPVFLSDVTQSSINVTWEFDTLPNPTKLRVDFGAGTTFDIWLHLTF